MDDKGLEPRAFGGQNGELTSGEKPRTLKGHEYEERGTGDEK